MTNLARKQGLAATPGKPSQPDIVEAAFRINPKAEPPNNLSDEAKAFWRSTLPGLSVYMKADDLHVFEQLCFAYGMTQVAQRDLNARGHIITTDKGNAVKNPSWSLWRESVNMFNALGGRFGLNPSDRKKMLGPTPETKPSKLLSMIR